jgi:hypothetical protein
MIFNKTLHIYQKLEALQQYAVYFQNYSYIFLMTLYRDSHYNVLSKV